MEVRADDRVPVALDGFAHYIGGKALVRVVDISTSGCRFVSESKAMRRGMTVLVSLAQGFDLTGRIVWQGKSAYGVAFNTQISLDDVDCIAAGHSQAGNEFVSAQNSRPIYPV